VKNQLGLIRALYDLPKPIVIVGQPAAAMPAYADQCKALGAKRGNVIFIERVPHEELPGIYALAAVHVLPSWRETPGLVSLEAAASGCRVVTTCIGSTRDYFGNLVEYCHPADHASIRTATERALGQPGSPALRNHVLEHFTWERAGAATLQGYRAALLDRHRTRIERYGEPRLVRKRYAVTTTRSTET
jgi:glycosyltransferase involved in cell wall biosynthesis